MMSITQLLSVLLLVYNPPVEVHILIPTTADADGETDSWSFGYYIQDVIFRICDGCEIDKAITCHFRCRNRYLYLVC